MSSISVCIATHERPAFLNTTLAALERQTHRPKEIVVSDSSASDDSQGVVEAFRIKHPDVGLTYVRSPRSALPFQRSLAFTRSSGEIILFLDDDVRLEQSALEVLDAAYEEHRNGVAGIGFTKTLAGGDEAKFATNGRRERWLRIDHAQPGTVTAGGITISHPSSGQGTIVETDWLWGGAMSYRRDVLESIGFLDHLVGLYERGIGKGEDAVLSTQARKWGKLLIIDGNYAVHPSDYDTKIRANPQSGWRRGLWTTWGRAHTMRWIAPQPKEARQEWRRLALLELTRAFRFLARSPWHLGAWYRLAGTLFGLLKTELSWNGIPPTPAQRRTSNI